MDKLKIDFKDKATILALVGSAFVLISVFLPAVKLDFMGIKETASMIKEYTGWIQLIASLAVLACLFLDIKIGVLGGAGVEVLGWIISFIGVNKDISDGEGLLKRDFGFFFNLVGFIILIVGAVMIGMKFMKEKKGGSAAA